MPEIRFEDEGPPPRVPRAMLMAAAAMMVFAMGLALTARLTDAGTTRVAATLPAAPTTVRELRFADRADGAVVITDAATGETVHVVEPGVNSFIRGAVRGLAFGRQRRGVGAEMPFRLSRWPDGRLTLGDPATGSVLDLDAYGGGNRRAFASLLPRVRQRISVNPP